MARILLTRPQARQAATRKRLEAAGHEVMAAPMLHFEATAEPMPSPAQDWAGILLTSGYPIAALDELPRALPLLATGEATAQIAREAGFTDVAHVDGAATDLASFVNGGHWHAGPGPLLAPRAERVAHDLSTLITRPVVPWTVYRMKPADGFAPDVEADLRRGRIDAVLLTSPAIAERFAALFAPIGGDISAPRLIALSQAVADAAGPELSPFCHVSRKPREADLLETLQSALAATPKGVA